MAKNYKYTLTHSSGSVVLDYNPMEWNDFNFIFARSERYFSILRHQIESLEFPRDGKVFIDNIKTTYGIDAEITCLIEYLDKSDSTYKTLVSGLVDLSEWKSRDVSTSVKIIDNSAVGKFAARDEIDIPLNTLNDLDGNVLPVWTLLNTMTVKGVTILSKAIYDDPNNIISINSSETIPWSEVYGVSDDGFDPNDLEESAELTPVNPGSNRYFYTNESGKTQTVGYKVISGVSGSVTITGTGNWDFTQSGYVGKVGGTLVEMWNETQVGSGNDFFVLNESYDSGYVELTLAPDEQLEIYHEWKGDVDPGDTILGDFDLNPIYVEVYEIVEPEADTEVEMPLLYEIGAKLLEAMTGESDILNSNVFGRTDSAPRTFGSDGTHALNALSSGNMLRQKSFSDIPLSLSFADYFKHISALYNVGLGYSYNTNDFNILEIINYYKNTKIIDLGEVTDLEISVFQDGYHNKILAGYTGKLDYEDLNGNQNYNVEAEFSNSGRAVNNTIDLRSPFRGDDYGIELSRKNADQIPTDQDSRYDEEIFAISAKRGVSDYVTLQGFDDFTDIEGIYAPETRLNLNITPVRNLLQNSNRLSVPLYISNSDVFFQKKQFELPLSTKKSGESTIVETDNIDYADLSSPLYEPDEYNFNADVTNEIIEQLLSDPHGYVEFTYQGTTYQGHIQQVSTEPFNRRGNWTLTKRA
jgi:hypothetical protein